MKRGTAATRRHHGRRAWLAALAAAAFPGAPAAGAGPPAPLPDQFVTATVRADAEARGLPWAYWQFESDFNLYDVDHDRWVEPIRAALIPAR